jgi:large subunit ribosomal protein L23
MKDIRAIIKQPLITEKSSAMRESNWYAFVVDMGANKREIREAVEKLFDVKVEKIRTIVVPGRTIKRLRRSAGRKPSWKKAYVKLKEGKIDFFEGV